MRPRKCAFRSLVLFLPLFSYVSPAASPPTCTLRVDKPEVRLGQAVGIRWSVDGWITSGRIIDLPLRSDDGAGTEIIITKTSGWNTVSGIVTGPGGTSTCEARYYVLGATDPTPEPPPSGSGSTKPSCMLTAQPPTIKLGESLVLELHWVGDVTSATLDGAAVDLMILKRIKTPSAAGSQASTARVSGPGGDAACSGTYQVMP